MFRYLSSIFVLISAIVSSFSSGNGEMLVPMDDEQTDHLKAYGLAYWAVKPEQGMTVKWLLNYRGGSFLFPDDPRVVSHANIMGVAYESVSAGKTAQIEDEIAHNNMDIVLLEKAPRIAVYSPSTAQPWDDAVVLALTYAEIDFTTIWDAEVLSGVLEKFDWLHLHHEDFTGQLGKFYAVYRNAPWYLTMQETNQKMAQRFGFATIPELKNNVASVIRSYVDKGGFLFAMCAATDTLDISLAALDIDIVPPEIDGTPIELNYQKKLNFGNCLAFENFSLVTRPEIYEYSDIDVSQENYKNAHLKEDFVLFEFAAKYDPIPAMLTQCHRRLIKGFLGQTTCFDKTKIKKNVVIMGEVKGENKAKYIHGTVGKGTFSFYGGHDPEDYAHEVGEAPTNLIFFKNSPGYRLILNNVLFPAAKKEKRKT
ncbi:MAG: asparagine synthetase B [bacterium]|nr:asparagine synthetase B [bacterium]